MSITTPPRKEDVANMETEGSNLQQSLLFDFNFSSTHRDSYATVSFRSMTFRGDFSPTPVGTRTSSPTPTSLPTVTATPTPRSTRIPTPILLPTTAGAPT